MQKGKLRCEHTFGLDNVSESRWDLSSSTDPGPNIWGVLTRTPGRVAGGSGWGGSFPGRQMHTTGLGPLGAGLGGEGRCG